MPTKDELPHEPPEATGPQIAVTRTGNATAASGSTAVTGYRGPAPGTLPASPVRVSGTGDAYASEGGFSSTGYIDQVSAEKLTMVQRAPRSPRAPAPWPHQVGVIPSRAQSFQGRAEAERLREVAADGGTTVLGQVLTGMGGVGKTQLAADYARTTWEGDSGDQLDVLLWITASTRSAVVTGYAQAGVELCQADPDDPEQAAQTFLAWLTPKSGAPPCRWLIILDDVADPDHLRHLWPPTSRHGRTLVTTRRRDAALTGEDRHRIDVGLFTETEAVAYLTRSLTAHHRHEPPSQLTALARDLGHLPLALAQAVAYLIESGEDTATYRDLLADRTTTLADTAPDRLPDDQAAPLAATWSLSLELADTIRPLGLARPMLQLIALLDPNGIPQTVLTSEPALTHLTAHRPETAPHPPGQPAPVSARDADRALRALDRLSLIDHTRNTPHQAVRVHQLIQRTTRDTLTSDQHDQLAHTAADALLAAWPEIERDTALAQTLRANTTALTTHAGQTLYRPDAHEVLFLSGTSLGEAGQAGAARDHYQSLTNSTAFHLGPEHLDTLAARHNLAYWQAEAGDTAGAATALAELLDDQIRVLGPDHPDTLTARHNLAQWQAEAGDTAGATTALAELLDDQIRVLGPDHPDTLTTRHNLAHWQGKAGDTAGATTALAELLDDQIRVLGPDHPDHPDTLAARHILAYWQGEAGDTAGAATALAELLDDQIRVLGPDHPDTLTTRHNLANWQGRAGDTAGATTAFAELLDDRIRVLGPDHPKTLNTRHNLAYWREEKAMLLRKQHLMRQKRQV